MTKYPESYCTLALKHKNRLLLQWRRHLLQRDRSLETGSLKKNSLEATSALWILHTHDIYIIWVQENC